MVEDLPAYESDGQEEGDDSGGGNEQEDEEDDGDANGSSAVDSYWSVASGKGKSKAAPSAGVNTRATRRTPAPKSASSSKRGSTSNSKSGSTSKSDSTSKGSSTSKSGSNSKRGGNVQSVVQEDARQKATGGTKGRDRTRRVDEPVAAPRKRGGRAKQVIRVELSLPSATLTSLS